MKYTLILAGDPAKAPAPVWKVARSSKTAAIVNIER